MRPAFFREAELLWSGEASNDSVLSIAAMEMLSTACILEGNDTLGQELAVTGRHMAERLGLFLGLFEKVAHESPAIALC